MGLFEKKFTFSDLESFFLSFYLFLHVKNQTTKFNIVQENVGIDSIDRKNWTKSWKLINLLNSLIGKAKTELLFRFSGINIVIGVSFLTLRFSKKPRKQICHHILFCNARLERVPKSDFLIEVAWCSLSSKNKRLIFGAGNQPKTLYMYENTPKSNDSFCSLCKNRYGSVMLKKFNKFSMKKIDQTFCITNIPLIDWFGVLA